VRTGFSLHLHDRRKKFQSLAAGRSLLSTYAPPPPDVPPANIQLMARTRDGPGLFMRCEQMWAGIVPPVVDLNLFWLCQPSAPGPLHKVTLIPHVTLNLFHLR